VVTAARGISEIGAGYSSYGVTIRPENFRLWPFTSVASATHRSRSNVKLTWRGQLRFIEHDPQENSQEAPLLRGSTDWEICRGGFQTPPASAATDL